MPGAPPSLFERGEINLALIEGKFTSSAEIARTIGRHPTTGIHAVGRSEGAAREF